MSQRLNTNTDDEKQWADEIEHDEYSNGLQSLPPRKEGHKKFSNTKSRQDKRKRKRRIRFPLVRVWLILFLLLVTLMTTYPLWG
ncbi:hypothetical protein CR194_02790 [Salipaludibacillus keqinensis]|uniref:Uncharacterized protein n=1 Tax=Salipaludibacillus keqinensis TaxID=2045207 RepID=A0A323TK60_9BACI|nr:hypothetical protein [Salipaludibacillus keqinensis]PYZ94476.1 hypothetical protein CR194_02790 [Salipaludibacillus keqinensis]